LIKISLNGLGKRFNNQWVFRNITLDFVQHNRYVILGSNGSGKSTLLQVIAGYRLPSEGSILITENGSAISENLIYQYLSIASPYLELIEEFNIEELFRFHFKLKPVVAGMGFFDFIAFLSLKNIKGKPIHQYSSGMKQRLRLALAFCTDTPLLLLDEPCSNLDADNIDWYRQQLEQMSRNKLTIICSNHQEFEYAPCENIIEIGNYKQPALPESR